MADFENFLEKNDGQIKNFNIFTSELITSAKFALHFGIFFATVFGFPLSSS